MANLFPSIRWDTFHTARLRKVDINADYYFSEDGSDVGTGTSEADPWQTIAKLNAEIAAGTFANKLVAFNRGDRFEGAIIGNGQNNMTFNHYGYLDEDIPIFTDTRSPVGVWVNHAGNVWKLQDTTLPDGGEITDTTIAFVNSNPDTITDTNNGFVAAGFKAGDTIVVSGSVANDGIYHIATVVAGTLTLNATDSLVAGVAGPSVTIVGKGVARVNGGNWPVRKMFIGGVEKTIGRYPNTDVYREMDNIGVPSTQVFDDKAGLGVANGYWNGGEVVNRANNYIISVEVIKDQTGDTITTTPASYGRSADFKYYIQNHVNCLDSEGDWCYDSAGAFGDGTPDTLYLYSTTNPNTLDIKVSCENYQTYFLNCDDCTFNNIEFRGADTYTFLAFTSDRLSFNDCKFSYSGFDGLRNTNSADLTVDGCTFEYIGNRGLFNLGVDTTITNNTFTDIGLDMGLGGNQGEYDSGKGSAIVLYTGTGGTVQYNSVSDCSYCGIFVLNSGVSTTTIDYNFVTGCCRWLVDGAGIYTVNTGVSNNVIDHNIVDDMEHASSIVMNDAANQKTQGHGIYCDDFSDNITITNNTCFNCYYTYYLHTPDTITLTDNLGYGGTRSGLFMQDDVANSDNITIEDNIFGIDEDNTSGYEAVYLRDMTAALATGNVTFDNNYILDPFNARSVDRIGSDTTVPDCNNIISEWNQQTFVGNDIGEAMLHSETLSGCAAADFVHTKYNATNAAISYALPNAIWWDVAGDVVSSPVTIQPYESIIVFRRNVSGGSEPTYSVQSQAVFDGMDDTPSSSRKDFIADLVDGLITDGIWAKLDRLWVFAAHSNTGNTALLDWMHPATAANECDLVLAPTFVADEGFTPAGGNSYISSNAVLSALTNYVQDSAVVGCYMRLAGINAGYAMGGQDAGGDWTMLYPDIGGNYGWRVNTNGSNSAANTDTQGLFGVSRNTATNSISYHNGALHLDGGAWPNSTGLPGVEIYIGGHNNNGAFGQKHSNQFSMAFLGEKLSTAEHGNLYTRFKTYMDALGRGVT